MRTVTVPASCLRKMRNIGLRDYHVDLLYNILLIPQIHTYLEIGCGQGVSTSAASQALKDRKDFYPAVCDVTMSMPVRELTRDRFQIFKGRSLQWLPTFTQGQWDCIFVDGDHSATTVAAEIVELRRLKPTTIIAHDTANKRIPGPIQFLNAFEGYETIHDERWLGFFIACNDKTVMDQIRELYVSS